jgi:hypothetical protein
MAPGRRLSQYGAAEVIGDATGIVPLPRDRMTDRAFLNPAH